MSIKCLIIGDSQTKYFSQFLPSSSDYKVTVNAMSGRKVQDVDVAALAEVQSFEHIILHLGTNNIPGESPDTTARKMDKLLKEVQMFNQECTLYISSVLPRAVSNFEGAKNSREVIEELNEKARTLNSLYQNLATRFERCFFFNGDEHFRNGGMVNRWLLSRDGLHLTRIGIKTLLGNMLSSLVCSSHKSSLPPSPPESAFAPLLCSSLSEVSPVASTSSVQYHLSYRDVLLSPSPVQSSPAPQSSCSPSFSPSQDRKLLDRKHSSSQRLNSFQYRNLLNPQFSKPSRSFRSTKTSGLSQPPHSSQSNKPSIRLSKSSFSLLNHAQSYSSCHSVSLSNGISRSRKRSNPKSDFSSTSSFLQESSRCQGKRQSDPKPCSSFSLQGLGPFQGKKQAKSPSSESASSQPQFVTSSHLIVSGGSRFANSSVFSQQCDPKFHSRHIRSPSPPLPQCGSPTQCSSLIRESHPCLESIILSHHSRSSCENRNTVYSSVDFQVPLVNKFQILRSKGNLFLPHHFVKRAKFPSYKPVNGGGRAKEFHYDLEPRKCDQCECSYKSKQAFSRHKKTCSVKNQALSSKYPRICEVCTNTFDSRQKFYNHKKACSSSDVLEEQNNQTTEHVPSASKSYEMTCDLCKKIFKRRQHFWLHSKICGKRTNKYPQRKCNACGNTYKNKDSFFSHKSRCGKKPAEKILYPRSCPTCSDTFCSCIEYRRHRKYCSGVGFAVPCLFTGCDRTFHSKKIMLHHLKFSHFHQATEILSFDSFSKFQEWKKVEDRRNFSFQKKVCGSKVLKNGSVYHYYKCMFNVPKRSEKRNQRKTVRRKKQGQIPESTCPSEMTVTEFYDGSISVKYISCHSHSLSEKNSTFHQWSPETRQKVKELLELGAHPNVIRKKFTLRKGINEPCPLRENFMTTREISRYKYWLKVQGRKAKDDATAIKKRVDAMTQEERNEILVYKPQGCNTYIGDVSFDSLRDPEKLFVYGFQTERQLDELKKGAHRAVCIDATYKTNRYDFNLINLLVPDEFGCGAIVAQFIINREDTDAYALLFRTIKSRCPDLYVNAVMTDDDPAIWNAFVAAFPQEDYERKTLHLLCSWHILNAWKKNLPKISDLKLRLEVKKELSVLLYEKNTEVFKQLLAAFIEKRSEPATAAFLEYFRSHYDNRTELWAMCYRNFAHGDINTNNMLESAHRVIKLRLGRKCNLMAYDLIEAVEDMEDVWWQKLYVRRRNGEPPKDFQNERDRRHRKGMQISSNMVEKLSEDKWCVKSLKQVTVVGKNKIVKIKNLTKKYNVIKKYRECNLPDHCYDKCSNLACFGLCSHLYFCSCPDTANLCKHVHRVHSFESRNIPHSLNIVTNKSFQFLDEKDQEEPESSFNADSVLSSDNTQTERNGEEKIAESIMTPSKNQAVNFEYLVDKLRNLTDNSDPDVKNHIIASLTSELQYCEAVKKSIIVPPMPCSFSPNQKSPLQPKMFKTKSTRSKSTASSLLKRKELNLTKHELLTFRKKTGPALNEIMLDLETPVDDAIKLPDPHFSEGQSPPPVVEPPTKKFVTEKSVQSVSKVSCAKKKKSFMDEIVSETVAKSLLQFQDFYVSLFELKSLDVDLSKDELKFLRGVSSCFKQGWLYDSVIDIYLGILCNEKPDVFVFRAPFVQTVEKTNLVEDCFYRLPRHNYKACKSLFIPSCLSENHWILLVVDVRGKKVLLFDPMQKDIQQYHEAVLTKWINVMSFLLEEDVSNWEKPCSPDHFLQTDSINCGPLTCYYVYKLLQNEDPKCYVDLNIFRKFIYSTIKSKVQPWIRSSC